MERRPLWVRKGSMALLYFLHDTERAHLPSSCVGLMESSGMIEGLVNDNKVMLFMKGNKMFPQCGFSNSAVQVKSLTSVRLV